MKQSILEKLQHLADRYEEVGALLSDPEVIGQQTRFRELSREYAELESVVKSYRDYYRVQTNIEEARALQTVVLKTSVKEERFALRAPSHHRNWKKVGLSIAYFRRDRIQESSMPTAKAKAAFRFLMEHNRFYKSFQELQGRLLANGSSLNVGVKRYSYIFSFFCLCRIGGRAKECYG